MIDIQLFKKIYNGDYTLTNELKVIEPKEIRKILGPNFQCSASESPELEFQYYPKNLIKLPESEGRIDIIAIQFYFDEFVSFTTVHEKIASSCFIIKNFFPDQWKKFRNIHLICIVLIKFISYFNRYLNFILF